MADLKEFHVGVYAERGKRVPWKFRAYTTGWAGWHDHFVCDYLVMAESGEEAKKKAIERARQHPRIVGET